MTATPTPIPTTSPPAPTPQTYTVELPVWPPSGNVFFQNAARCFNKWIALGLNPTVAYGLVANAEAESAFEVKAVGDNDTAYGVYQWHWTPRGAAILAATGIDVRSDPKIENHVAAAYWELTHLFAASWAQIQQAKTALDAGSLVCTMYERAGAAFAVERRGAMAERWLAYFAANPDILKDNPPQG